jgi:glycosyltransferase involved in cell wall biosynthesis
MPPSLSLVVAVYNKPENLRLVLAALSRQTFSNAEIIVADDGSGPAVADVVSWGRDRYGLEIVHLWHEDRGWRKNTMLNAAIRAARSPYLVFIDGDCIPARRFLEDHDREREPGRVLIGRRVETGQRWASTFTLERVESGKFEEWGWDELKDTLAGRALRVEDGLRMPNALVRRLLLRKVRGMLGSNFSAWKSDLEAINGFDELYDGPGCGEDSDIQFRLGLHGVSGKSLRNLAVQYHLWHPLTRVSDPCWDRFQAVKASRRPWCDHGLVPPKTAEGGQS